MSTSALRTPTEEWEAQGMGCEKGAVSHLLAWHGGKRKPRLPHSHWGEIPKLWISIRKEVKLLGLGAQMNKKSNKKNGGRCHGEHL